MFVFVEDRREIAEAQRMLAETLRAALPNRTTRDIGYPSDTVLGAQIWTDGSYWFRTVRHGDAARPRVLNWFGRTKPTGALHIAVEVNTPIEGRDDMVAGFFAKDSETGTIYLFHSGRVGGGKKGVGKESFLAWVDRPPMTVFDPNGRPRYGILVMPIEGSAAAQAALKYVDDVVAFKEFVGTGGAQTPAFQRVVQGYRDYFDEASGRRTGTRKRRIDYVSRHGDIVRALHDWRSQTLGSLDERMVKSVLLDLGVERSGRLVEAYEVKTSTDRQNLYAAIGQLLVHGGEDGCTKYLVCPDDLSVPADIETTLERLSISRIRVRVSPTKVLVVP